MSIQNQVAEYRRPDPQKARSRLIALVSLVTISLTIGTWRAGDSAPPIAAQSDEPDLRVDVEVKNIARLYGAAFSLRYDPAKLVPVDADPQRPGIQIEIGPAWGPSRLVLVNEVETESNHVFFEASLLGDVPAIEGDALIATILFERQQLEVAGGCLRAEPCPLTRQTRSRSALPL